MSNVKFEKGCTISFSDCETINLSNCKFPEGSSIDLSKCKQVTLSNVDLSKVDIKLPEQGKIYIDENVKFAPERTLDFSKCQDAVVHPSAECSEIKLPTKGDVNFKCSGKLHKNVKEVTSEYISKHRLMVPEGVKIIDAPMENGKKVSLDLLSKSGLSKKQISDLRKEWIIEPFKALYNKFSGKSLAVADTKQAINETKKQQAAEQAKKEQTPKPQQNQVLARRVAELRGIKPAQSQKKPVQVEKQQKPIEKGVWDKFTDLFSR